MDRGNNIDDHDSTEELDDEDDFNEIEDLGVDDGLDDEGLYEEELEETDSRNDGSDRFRQSSSHLEVIDLSDVETDNIALTPDNDEEVESFDFLSLDSDPKILRRQVAARNEHIQKCKFSFISDS